MYSSRSTLFALVTAALLACLQSHARAENASSSSSRSGLTRAPGAFRAARSLLLNPASQPVVGIHLFGVACPELRQYVDAAVRLETAFDGIFVRVGMLGGAPLAESRMGASRTEVLAARDEMVQLSMFDSAMLSAGAAGVVAQLAWKVVTGDAAGGLSRTNGHTDLVIVPGGVVARGSF